MSRFAEIREGELKKKTNISRQTRPQNHSPHRMREKTAAIAAKNWCTFLFVFFFLSSSLFPVLSFFLLRCFIFASSWRARVSKDRTGLGYHELKSLIVWRRRAGRTRRDRTGRAMETSRRRSRPRSLGRLYMYNSDAAEKRARLENM